MLIHCLSPEPKCSIDPKCSYCHHHCDYSSECLCLENNIQTDNYNNINFEGKLTYEINSKGNDDFFLKKANSLFNIREKIYNKNNIKLNENNSVINCKNVLSKCKYGSNKKRSCINKNIIRNNINKKNELLEKINKIILILLKEQNIEKEISI